MVEMSEKFLPFFLLHPQTRSRHKNNLVVVSRMLQDKCGNNFNFFCSKNNF